MAQLPPTNPFYTILDFERNPQNAADLSTALRIPAVGRALQALVSAGLPTSTPVGPGADPIMLNALANQRREGFFEFYTRLLSLSHPADAPLPTQPEPWAHIKKQTRKRGTHGLPASD